MLRVLHVTEAPGWGIFSLLEQFTREQIHRGGEVHLLAPPRMRRLPGVQHRDWTLDRGRPWTWPRGLHELRQTVREIRPDVVHLHSFFGGFFGRLPGALGDVPVVYQPHAWSFDVVGNRVMATAMRGWERLAARRTTVLVANCTDEIDEGRRAGVDRPSVSLGVAVDTDRFAPVDEEVRQQHRRDLGLGETSLLLALGRLAHQKGQDLLVAAWERQPAPDAELVLVGLDDDGTLARLAPTQWGRTVRSVPPVTDVRPWLWACDVLVLPSRYETVSIAVAEALSCGRPVVATAVNGVADTVSTGPLPPGGTVVPVGDMTALLAESERLLADPERRGSLGTAARTRAVALFTPAAVVDRLEQAYRLAIDTYPARRRTQEAA